MVGGRSRGLGIRIRMWRRSASVKQTSLPRPFSTFCIFRSAIPPEPSPFLIGMPPSPILKVCFRAMLLAILQRDHISYRLCFYSYLFYLALLIKIIIKISDYLLTLTLRERSLTKTRNENMIAWSCIRGKLILVKM